MNPRVLARINVGLAAVLMIAALLLVTSQHRARRLAIDLERAQGQMRELDVRHSHPPSSTVHGHGRGRRPMTPLQPVGYERWSLRERYRRVARLSAAVCPLAYHR